MQKEKTAMTNLVEFIDNLLKDRKSDFADLMEVRAEALRLKEELEKKQLKDSYSEGYLEQTMPFIEDYNNSDDFYTRNFE